ncbi:MAG: Ig-like domain-containing protein [Acidobacteriaceae bacterium]|jgi:hypothetical protein|nr:Ig-like domain-containing protein [Acidobacteriaceae bacterium]
MATSKRALLLVVLVGVTLTAQTQPRHATNLMMLVAQSGYFHGRPVTVVGDIKVEDSGALKISAEGSSLPMLAKNGAAEGLSEVRGEFWDLGRMNADDPRLHGYDLKRAMGIDPEGAWPHAGTALALVLTATQAATTPTAPSIRNIVLYPSRYLDQTVTVVGQFSGRNLLGDLPDTPAQSRYDFVLRSADAAIWVTNLRPKGRDFDLPLDARSNTNRWLEVTGRVQQRRGLQWIDGQQGIIKLASPPSLTTDDTQKTTSAPAPPPEVVFSAPIEDDIDVSPASSVRLQFSRDIDPTTLRTHIHVTDVTNTPDGAASAAPPIEFTFQYVPGTRVLELKFPAPLDPQHTIKVELLDEILGTDKQPLVPWVLRFTTGS